MEENNLQTRTRSFRNEDYNNRRAFLRSYPLQWGDEEEFEKEEPIEKETSKVTNDRKAKKPMKKIILSLLSWGGEKVLVIRRFKHKVAIYVVTCLPLRFRPHPALISI